MADPIWLKVVSRFAENPYPMSPDPTFGDSTGEATSGAGAAKGAKGTGTMSPVTSPTSDTEAEGD